MKLKVSPISICRTPIFPINEELKNVWHELKNYIHESSPSFFEVIKELEYTDLEYAEPKVRFTIWKYFNRAKYRATPYGNFAAFTLVPIIRENQEDHLIFLKKTIIHRFPNWQEKEKVSLDPKWLSLHANFLRSNTTAYPCGEELRYVNIEDGNFELSSIELENTTLSTLNFCRKTTALQEVQHFLQHKHGLSRPITNYFIEQLIALQLLLTDFQPNIIGTDYFERVAYPIVEKKNDYIIAERIRASGHLSEKSLQILVELTNFMVSNSLVNTNQALNNFKESFTKRFGNVVVPLLVAMDPEIGIGYRSLAQDKEEDQLLQDLKMNRQEPQTAVRKINYTPLHQFILNEMVQQKVVQLYDFKETNNTHKAKLANTISIMLQYADEHLIVEQMGGSTANSLLGRFTMASEEITAMGNRFAETERQSNPGVMFFDIAYQIEKNTDNINRRKSVYNCELPILSWPESPDVLDPDDIMLSIKGNELILHSAKYGKRLVPKLASAYNYSRSDLAIYRFLSDLQHQNLNSGIEINVAVIFPGLSHYQRIQYKNVILSPEKWLIPKSICVGVNTEQSLPALQNWLISINLKKPFKCGFADQTLIFNPEIEEDMLSFLLFCRNKTALYIEESFIPRSPLIYDENNKGYLAEFIVNLEHTEQLYQPYPLKEAIDDYKNRAIYLPGEEWLYFEIYCHPSKSSTILLYIAQNYLHPLRKKIKKWFFIRYNDPSYHIRLRFQLINTADLSEFISGLSTLLKPYITTGIITDLQLKTYRREIERYGAAGMERVEKHFELNSEFILYLIKKPVTIHSLYHLSLLLMEHIFHAASYPLQEQLQFAERMAQSFSSEMSLSSEGLKKINQGYKDFINSTAQLQLHKLQHKKLNQMVQSFLSVISSCPAAERNTLLADLFHMHTNRLFHDDQRLHELIMYQYLTRKLKMKIGRLQQEKQQNEGRRQGLDL